MGRWARLWFGATALCVAAGVAISVYSAVTGTGHFHQGVERGFNTFAFFTVQSNLLVGGTSLVLAVRPRPGSTLFAVVRLTSLVAITVTGVVYHVALSRVLVLSGIHQFGNQLVHTVVPLLCVVGWLLFGPRRLTSVRIAFWSLVFPAAWLAFTLIRGAVVHWYPYPFIDVDRIGYAKTALNCSWVLVLLLGLAAGATVVDRHLRAPSGGPGGTVLSPPSEGDPARTPPGGASPR